MPLHSLSWNTKRKFICIKLVSYVLVTLFTIFICGCRNTSEVSPEEFAHKASILKKQQKWHECVKEGNKALASVNDKNSTDNDARINILLETASPHFYLGDFENCFKAAEEAYNIACCDKNYKGMITALYLQSAAKRGQKKRLDAITLIETAKKTSEDSNLDLSPELHSQLTGKVYFNSSAIYTDLIPYDLSKGRNELRHALASYKNHPYQNERDIKRCERRISGIELREANYLQAKLSSTELIRYYENQSDKKRDHREHMLCLEISGSAKYHLCDNSCKNDMLKAIQLSKNLKGQEDEKRIMQKLKDMKPLTSHQPTKNI